MLAGEWGGGRERGRGAAGLPHRGGWRKQRLSRCFSSPESHSRLHPPRRGVPPIPSTWARGQEPAGTKPPQNNNENPAGKAKSPQLIFIRVGFAICCLPSRPGSRGAGKAAELRGSSAKPASLHGQAGTPRLPVPPKQPWAERLHPKTAWDELGNRDSRSSWGGMGMEQRSPPGIHPRPPGLARG